MHDEVALGLDGQETQRPISRESSKGSGDEARPTSSGRSFLADLIEELTPGLVRQAAKEGEGASARPTRLLAALVKYLCNGRVEVASCTKTFDIATDSKPM
jgi:hypothetical protein